MCTWACARLLVFILLCIYLNFHPLFNPRFFLCITTPIFKCYAHQHLFNISISTFTHLNWNPYTHLLLETSPPFRPSKRLARPLDSCFPFAFAGLAFRPQFLSLKSADVHKHSTLLITANFLMFFPFFLFFSFTKTGYASMSPTVNWRLIASCQIDIDCGGLPA